MTAKEIESLKEVLDAVVVLHLTRMPGGNTLECRACFARAVGEDKAMLKHRESCPVLTLQRLTMGTNGNTRRMNKP